MNSEIPDYSYPDDVARQWKKDRDWAEDRCKLLSWKVDRHRASLISVIGALRSEGLYAFADSVLVNLVETDRGPDAQVQTLPKV